MSSVVSPALSPRAALPPSARTGASGPGRPKKVELTEAAKASIWDWAGDAAFAAVIGLCAAFGRAYGQKGSRNILDAIGDGFYEGNGFGGLATVVVGPAIFLYLGHRANRFPFLPSSARRAAQDEAAALTPKIAAPQPPDLSPAAAAA